MRILGIDQSLSSCGFAVVDDSEADPILLYSHLERFKNGNRKMKSVREKLARFEDILWSIYHAYTIDIVVSELMRAGTNNRNTAIVLGMLLGVTARVTPTPVPLVLLNVSTWRSVLLPKGYTADPKQAAIAYLMTHFGVTLDEHRAEAVCLCRAYPLLQDETNKSKVLFIL